MAKKKPWCDKRTHGGLRHSLSSAMGVQQPAERQRARVAKKKPIFEPPGSRISARRRWAQAHGEEVGARISIWQSCRELRDALRDMPSAHNRNGKVTSLPDQRNFPKEAPGRGGGLLGKKAGHSGTMKGNRPPSPTLWKERLATPLAPRDPQASKCGAIPRGPCFDASVRVVTLPFSMAILYYNLRRNAIGMTTVAGHIGIVKCFVTQS
jgi:hypothetical protein